jgi:hypothetical protein
MLKTFKYKVTINIIITMTILTIPNVCIASILFFFLFSGEKSCMTLLIIENIKNLFKLKNIENKDQQEETEQKKEKVEVRFEDKYLKKWLEMEEKELSKEKIDSLKNSVVIENTPQGNVLMHWDSSKDSFVYYADHIIPYRFLEVVGRKYVIMNDCKKLYVNMEEEINAAKKKLEEKKLKEELMKQEEQERLENKDFNEDKNDKPKRNVFAKLKSYNKNSSIKSATVALDPKKQSNVPKNTAVNTKEQEDMILKENANRYSHQGRLANYSFLKKVDRKLVDKNYALSFAEFKKLNKQNKN